MIKGSRTCFTNSGMRTIWIFSGRFYQITSIKNTQQPEMLPFRSKWSGTKQAKRQLDFNKSDRRVSWRLVG